MSTRLQAEKVYKYTQSVANQLLWLRKPMTLELPVTLRRNRICVRS